MDRTLLQELLAGYLDEIGNEAAVMSDMPDSSSPNVCVPLSRHIPSVRLEDDIILRDENDFGGRVAIVLVDDEHRLACGFGRCTGGAVFGFRSVDRGCHDTESSCEENQNEHQDIRSADERY